MLSSWTPSGGMYDSLFVVFEIAEHGEAIPREADQTLKGCHGACYRTARPFSRRFHDCQSGDRKENTVHREGRYNADLIVRTGSITTSQESQKRTDSKTTLPPYDIFRKSADGAMIWIEAAKDLQSAETLARNFSRFNEGEFLVLRRKKPVPRIGSKEKTASPDRT